MNTYAIGDIHGGFKALLQVLHKANFDYQKDKLISLGDLCDGWSETPEVIEELKKIKNLIYCKGNHDAWSISGLSKENGFMSFHGDGASWFRHGGKATVDAYERRPELLESHLEFLKAGVNYYIDEENRLFLHAGFNVDFPIDKQPLYYDQLNYYWDRSFWARMYAGRNDGKAYKEVYIGHTPTIGVPKTLKEDTSKPVNRRNVWNMDTGACFTGKLSMMNIDTKELFQSDEVRMLYPNEFGRNNSVYQSIMKK